MRANRKLQFRIFNHQKTSQLSKLRLLLKHQQKVRLRTMRTKIATIKVKKSNWVKHRPKERNRRKIWLIELINSWQDLKVRIKRRSQRLRAIRVKKVSKMRMPTSNPRMLHILLMQSWTKMIIRSESTIMIHTWTMTMMSMRLTAMLFIEELIAKVVVWEVISISMISSKTLIGMVMVLSMILTLTILIGPQAAGETVSALMIMMMPSSELVAIEVSQKKSGPWENSNINVILSNLKRNKRNLRMLIKMFTKLSHHSLLRKTQLIKILEVKCLRQRKWGLNSGKGLQRELLKKEELPWNVKGQWWKKNKKKERESLSRLEIRSKLRAKLYSYIARLKSFKDKSFLLKMPVKKLLKRLGNSRLTSNLHRELKQQLKRLNQESKNAENGWRSIEKRYLN